MLFETGALWNVHHLSKSERLRIYMYWLHTLAHVCFLNDVVPKCQTPKSHLFIICSTHSLFWDKPWEILDSLESPISGSLLKVMLQCLRFLSAWTLLFLWFSGCLPWPKKKWTCSDKKMESKVCKLPLGNTSGVIQEKIGSWFIPTSWNPLRWYICQHVRAITQCRWIYRDVPCRA